MLIKVEELTDGPVAGPPLPHVRHARHRDAGRAGPASRASRRLRRVPGQEVPDLDGRRLRHPRGRHRQRGHVRRAGPLLGDRPPPMLEYVAEDVPARPAARRHADDGRVPAPVPRARQPTLPNGGRNPAYDDVDLERRRTTAASTQREGFIRTAYEEADETLTLARKLIGQRPDHVRVLRPRLRAAVPGHRRQPAARRARAAVDAADRRTAARPPARRSARRRPAGPAARVQIYLNVAGRDPVGRRLPAGRRGRRRGHRRSRSRPRTSAWPTRTTGPTTASPRAGRSSTARSPRPRRGYIPNGPGSTTDMAHPTRTGDLVVFAYPPYQFDAETPGTLVAPSHFFGQHGYVPDVQDLRANINMRATFLAGGAGIAQGHGQGAHDRPRADAGVPARHPRAAAQPGQGAAATWSRAGSATSR